MAHFEYAVLPTPTELPRRKGVKGAAARFSAGLTELLNAMGRDGWEYVRADTMVASEKSRILRKPQETRIGVLVFRRPLDRDAAQDDRDSPPLTAAPRPDPAAWDDDAAPDWPAPPQEPAPQDDDAPDGDGRTPLAATRGTPGRLRPVPGAGRD
ncbi:hypothetical protein E2L08_09020 [Palleronia sediminis]|uniref:DUF4177 domain-containing protein n=1 Tax=Palleronia sediminis TaxID=2547833 RepID=A0A4R6A9Z4_9RHOB|nr:hypothetical protein [Palleronia sediminis]TDL79735.1 hypothetical protein E2L08_09020 [Palleronia sediminis]